MFKQIQSIDEGGVFTGYRWDPSLPDLARINVIFGSNGVGKTSLARVFDTAVREATNGPLAQFLVADESGIRATSYADDPIFARVLVFSDEFVDRNHRFSAGDADLAAVLTLGERAADAEDQLAELSQLLASQSQDLEVTRTAVRAAERALRTCHERVSISVVGDLTRLGGRYQSRSNYSVSEVKRMLAGDRTDFVVLSPSELAQHQQEVMSTNREVVGTAQFDLQVRVDLAQRINAKLSEAPLSVVLDSLREHPHASLWVQEGQRLHTDLEDCLFCGGPLSADRMEQITQHFSDEVSTLQGELANLDRELERLEHQLDGQLLRVPDRLLLFEDLRDSYDVAVNAWAVAVEESRRWVSGARETIEAKRTNILGAVPALTDLAVPSPSAVRSVIDAHNDRVRSHEQLVETSARAIELHHLASDAGEADEKGDEIAAAVARVSSLEAALEETRLRIAELERVDGDPTPSAAVLTREVGRLLGRDELRFEAADGRYRVTRGGDSASHLSTGERTAIALVHFLEVVARRDSARGKSIVVIDDPVSSLDSNVFMGVSTYIWAETVAKDHVAQVILLTHNFELFRQWDIQIEGLHRGERRRVAYPAQLYEIQTRHNSAGGTARRTSVLRSWPPSPAARKKIRSAYHHSFLLAAEAKMRLLSNDSLEERLDAQLLFPNVVRRLLETFLAFKRPEWVGDFTTAMRNSARLLDAGGYEGDADALRLALTRYAHAHSHSESPATDAVIAPEEIHSAIGWVFTFMQHVDRDHFNGMCEVLGLDAGQLVVGTAADGPPS